MPRISRRAGVALVCAGALACAVVGMLLGVLAAGGHHPHILSTRQAVTSPTTQAPPASVVTVVSTAAPPPRPKPKPKHHPRPGDGKPGPGPGPRHHHHHHPGDGNDQGGG